MTELQILTAVQNSDGYIEYSALLNQGQTDSPWVPTADRDLIKDLISAEILSGKAESRSPITFGKHGHRRLRDLQQAAQQQADQAADETRKKLAQRKHEWNMVLATAALSSIATVVAQLIVNWILG